MSVEEYEDLANKNCEPKRAILNLDWNIGTHWVGCKTDNFGNILYYDPFGVNPPFKNLKRNIIFNCIKDQELNEMNCGWRSLFFVLND